MNFTLTGKAAIVFARVWGIVAILFGLFIVFIAIHDILKTHISLEQLIIKGVMVLFGVGAILLGRFFLTTKMGGSNERKS